MLRQNLFLAPDFVCGRAVFSQLYITSLEIQFNIPGNNITKLKKKSVSRQKQCKFCRMQIALTTNR